MKKIKGEELEGRELEVLEDGTLRLIKEKPTRYIPQAGETYYFISVSGTIRFATNENLISDSWLINHYPVFRTCEDCEEYKKFFELLNEYKCNLNWGNENDEEKYYLRYDKSTDCLDISHNLICQTQGTFYFKSIEDVNEFITKAGENKIKRYMFDVWE